MEESLLLPTGNKTKELQLFLFEQVLLCLKNRKRHHKNQYKIIVLIPFSSGCIKGVNDIADLNNVSNCMEICYFDGKKEKRFILAAFNPEQKMKCMDIMKKTFLQSKSIVFINSYGFSFHLDV